MFLIRLAQSCTLSLHFAWCSAGFGPYSGPTFSSAFGKELAFGTNLRRADSIFHFIIFSFALRRLAGATIEPRTRPFAPLVSDGNNRSIARRMAFSPVSVKVAFAVPSIRAFGKKAPSKRGLLLMN